MHSQIHTHMYSGEREKEATGCRAEIEGIGEAIQTNNAAVQLQVPGASKRG